MLEGHALGAMSRPQKLSLLPGQGSLHKLSPELMLSHCDKCLSWASGLPWTGVSTHSLLNMPLLGTSKHVPIWGALLPPPSNPGSSLISFNKNFAWKTKQNKTCPNLKSPSSPNPKLALPAVGVQEANPETRIHVPE